MWRRNKDHQHYFWGIFTPEKASTLNQWTFPLSVLSENSAYPYGILSRLYFFLISGPGDDFRETRRLPLELIEPLILAFRLRLNSWRLISFPLCVVRTDFSFWIQDGAFFIAGSRILWPEPDSELIKIQLKLKPDKVDGIWYEWPLTFWNRRH